MLLNDIRWDSEVVAILFVHDDCIHQLIAVGEILVLVLLIQCGQSVRLTLIQSTSSLNGPACLSPSRMPIPLTSVGSSG